MGKTLKRIALFTIGAGAAWAAAIKPRTKNKPDMSAFFNYDYADGGVGDFMDGCPENSDASLREAVNKGYGVALDVRVTRDGVPVVFRDSDLYRLCGVDGVLEEHTLAEISEYYIQETEEKVLTLEEALDLVNCRVPVVIKLDVYKDNYGTLSQRVCEIVDCYEGVYTIESEDYRVLRWFAKERPKVIRGLVYKKKTNPERTFGAFVSCFIHNSMLTNVFARPDYISAVFDDRDNMSIKLCRLLYHVPIALRNVRDEIDYEIGRQQDAVVIFEGIEP